MIKLGTIRKRIQVRKSKLTNPGTATKITEARDKCVQTNKTLHKILKGWHRVDQEDNSKDHNQRDHLLLDPNLVRNLTFETLDQ